MRCRFIIAGVGLAAVLGAGITVYAGWYDISATDQHLAPTYWLLDTGMRRSIKYRARGIAAPDLADPARIRDGAFLYRQHCLQCHGAPGVAPAPFALGMTPVPVPLVHTARSWTPAEMFWVVKEGIKMTGMPAWEFRMSEEDIWSVVALVQRLPYFSPDDYRRTAVPGLDAYEARASSDWEVSIRRGRIALQQYACVACHRIPGITGHEARVGPPLAGIASRTMLGGVLSNSPDNMVRWIREPQQASPLTAMPDLGVTERDARDMAAYLSTLR